MRLLKAETKELVHFDQKDVPKYAALSHTWREDEVLFEDIQSEKAIVKTGYRKISRCCKQALSDGLEYVWIDTCAIDKSSSAELQEAINSMYRWYEEATVCYAFLDDFDCPCNPDWPSSAGLEKCRWFSRGWTLQELLAPRDVVFFDRDWAIVGAKHDKALCKQLSYITAIPVYVLQGGDIQRESIASRMSWASRRKTTREEDLAYCLLGIFNVNMPMLYGEGENAFIRLQEEILRSSNDDSILAWSAKKIPFYSSPTPHPLRSCYETVGVLAKTPAYFRYSGDIVSYTETISHPSRLAESMAITNRGLRLAVPLQRFNLEDNQYGCTETHSFSLGMLSCYSISKPGYHLAVLMIKLPDDRFERVLVGGLRWSFHSILDLPTETIVVLCKPSTQPLKRDTLTKYLPTHKIYIGALVHGLMVQDLVVSNVHGAIWNKYTRAAEVYDKPPWKVALRFHLELALVLVIGKQDSGEATWCSLAMRKDSLELTCENTLPPSSVLQTTTSSTALDSGNPRPNENTTSESVLYKFNAQVRSDLIMGERVLRVDLHRI